MSVVLSATRVATQKMERPLAREYQHSPSTLSLHEGIAAKNSPRGYLGNPLIAENQKEAPGCLI